MEEVICNYCGNPAEWVNNKEIYGRSYGTSNQMAWLCRPCDAYVGCHNNTREPLGILANKELRELKKDVKNLWISKRIPDYKTAENWEKNEEYDRLAKELGILRKDCHFGYFDKEMLLKIKDILLPLTH